jgi:hypothetical protein
VFYEFFWRECKVDYVAPLKGMIDLAAVGGWWWPFENAVILTERPVHLSRDSRNRLHDEHGPAISYSDGWGVYVWHGLRVPRWVIESPEKITVEKIDAEANAEVRRVLVERYGLARYATDSGAQVVHEDKDLLGFPRRLLRKTLRDVGDVLLVEVRNSTLEPDGSRKTYLLPVHPELRPIPPTGSNLPLGEPQALTCRNAVASTFYLRGEQYAPEVET